MRRRVTRLMTFGIFLMAGLMQPGGARAQTTFNQSIGKPNRLLFGLGANNLFSYIQSQGIKPDIIDNYLVGVGAGQWPYWNSPLGAYVTVVSDEDEAVGAVPMFTLYQMITYDDGETGQIGDTAFMTAYWSQAKLMFQLIGKFGKPVLVNVEPDFWGFVEYNAPGGDPSKLYAYVKGEPECAALPNTPVGIVKCVLKLRDDYAPKAKIGFPPSFFGATPEQLGHYMVALGADKADFVTAQTYDRDAGCEEVSAPPPECAGRGAGPFYWDIHNKVLPDFKQNLAAFRTVDRIEGKLPIIYWQTPMGVASSTPGGSTGHYRDDHVFYMFRHPLEYANANVVGIVFSAGAASQTTIETDGGQFPDALTAYLANPTPLAVIADGVYEIVNRHSGLALEDVGAGVGTPGAPALVDQERVTGFSDQVWAVSYLGDGKYRLVNQAAGQPLGVAQAGGSSAKLSLRPPAGAADQIWTVTPAGAGSFALSPAYDGGLRLDDFYHGTAAGAAAGVWTAQRNGVDQEWVFEAR